MTAQCFTNALCVGNENGSGGKLNIQLRWHTQTWTHLHRHSHDNGRRAKGRRVISLTSGCCSSLPLYLPTSLLLPLSLFFFHCFLLISLWIKHFTTALPFLSKTPFFLLLFIVFLLQNMYRLFRTTTKIQYPIYMQFLLFNNHQFIRWILLEFLFLLIVPSPLSQMAYSPCGCSQGAGVDGRGTNKYIGQDVKKLKQEFWLFLNPDNSK